MIDVAGDAAGNYIDTVEGGHGGEPVSLFDPGTLQRILIQTFALYRLSAKIWIQALKCLGSESMMATL